MKINNQNRQKQRSQRWRFWAAWLLATIAFGAVLCLESRNRQFLAVTTALAIMEVPVPSSIESDIDGVDTSSVAKEDAIATVAEAPAAILSAPAQSTSSLPSSCPLSSGLGFFVPHDTATKLIHDYASTTIASGQKPRFPPILQKLLEYATTKQQYFVTVQIGGMDGKTGDPLYRMTELHGKKSLQYWVPVVLEPVPANYAKLQATYQTHQEKRKLQCPLLLNSLISYTGDSNTCDFCHFDDASTKPECHDMPNWKKSEIGSMDCSREISKDSCFTKSQLQCGTVERALRIDGSGESNNLLSENLMVLQVDVEGFEQQVLEGFLKDRLDSKLPLPPVIHFESRILKARGTLDALYALLRSHGYSLHEKRVDTLCLLGFQGPETSVN